MIDRTAELSFLDARAETVITIGWPRRRASTGNTFGTRALPAYPTAEFGQLGHAARLTCWPLSIVTVTW